MSNPTNPFKLQTDNKKFFFNVANNTGLQTIPEFTKSDTGANRIKNMDKELESLAKKKQEMMFRESEVNYIFKKEKPVMQLGEFITSVVGQPAQGSKDKKFRVRALLKEKKQSVHEFLEKKKEIYLSKMNINIKKEQTAKLQDQIKDEEETLKARKLYFENDVQFMHKFIDGIKKQAEEAQAAVQHQLKIQQTLVSKLNSLDAETEKIDNLISKETEVLQDLLTYKKFIDSFYDPERHHRPYQPQHSNPLYLTEGKQQVEGEEVVRIGYMPQNMIEIFNNAEENNIREIQNLHDKEDEVEGIIKVWKREETNLENIIKQSEARVAALERTLSNKLGENTRLKELKKSTVNKMSIFDNQNIDLKTVSGRILEIYRQIAANSPQSQKLQGQNEKIMKKAMVHIQQKLQQLRLALNAAKAEHPSIMTEAEKELKARHLKANQERKKEEAKRQQLQRQKQQEKKKNEQPAESLKGRRPMGKVLLQKKKVVKKQVDSGPVDESEKYFQVD